MARVHGSFKVVRNLAVRKAGLPLAVMMTVDAGLTTVGAGRTPTTARRIVVRRAGGRLAQAKAMDVVVSPKVRKAADHRPSLGNVGTTTGMPPTADVAGRAHSADRRGRKADRLVSATTVTVVALTRVRSVGYRVCPRTVANSPNGTASILPSGGRTRIACRRDCMAGRLGSGRMRTPTASADRTPAADPRVVVRSVHRIPGATTMPLATADPMIVPRVVQEAATPITVRDGRAAALGQSA
jgi:hypothetical protein